MGCLGSWGGWGRGLEGWSWVRRGSSQGVWRSEELGGLGSKGLDEFGSKGWVGTGEAKGLEG